MASRPDAQFDGVTKVTFSTEGIGATPGSHSNVSSADSSQAQAPSAAEDSGNVGVDMEVTFYHCREGNFWNLTPSSDGDYATCKLCTDIAEGDTEVMSARGYVDSDYYLFIYLFIFDLFVCFLPFCCCFCSVLTPVLLFLCVVWFSFCFTRYLFWFGFVFVYFLY